MREEEKKRFFKKINLKRFFKRRWVLPTIYILSATLLLTAVVWYQVGGKQLSDPNNVDNEITDISQKKINEDELALEVNRPVENFVMPVTDPDSVIIKQHFYDSQTSKAEQEAALVFYNNQYHPNKGINIGTEDDTPFEVVASLSGSVAKVEEDPLLGNVIEIVHDEGIVTQYQAVQDIKVSVGDYVEQGQLLASAGKSQFNKEAGTHVHFEIRKDNVALDPLEYFNKPLTSLTEATDDAKNEDANEETSRQSEADERSEAEDEQSKNNDERDATNNNDE